MILLAEDIIHFNKFQFTTKKCHSLKKIWLPLLSVPQLCKSKLTVTFKRETVEISDSDGNIIITGYPNPVKDLFMVPINDVSSMVEYQKVNMSLTSGFTGATGQRVETGYDGVVSPILLTVEQHTAANTHTISCVSALISYLHACASFPVIVTWIIATNKG